jgi:hypothetical protein
LQFLHLMLLKIYKTNPFLLLLSGIALSLVIWIVTILKPGETTRSYTDITLLAPFFDQIHNYPILKAILGYAMLLAEAATWNRIVNKHSLLRQSTYFPFFFLIILLSCRASLIGFYPALASSLFLVLAIHKLISSYMKEKALPDAFDSGLFVGIATLFYIPSMLFLVLLWIGLLIIRTANWREWLCTILGFLVPFIFTFTYNIVFFPNYPWFHKIASEFSYHSVQHLYSWEQITLLIIILITALGSLWFYMNKITDNVVKTQKFWTLMLWFILIASGSVLLCPVKDSRAFSILAIPGSFVMSAYFLKTKARNVPELSFLLLIGGVIISMFF